MEYNLTPFKILVDQGFLLSSEDEDLILFNYTDRCVYEKYWNEYTSKSRGLILNKNNGAVIAKPFPKFFNLNQVDETQFKNLPSFPYTVSTKVDGSLGIIFHYKDQWRIATRGSFKSEQAVRGAKILQQYNLSKVPTYITLLTEIIYPENKIVVNYGKEEKLVLLSAFNRENEQEIGLDIEIDMPKVAEHKITIEEAINLSKTLSKDNEGFVVRFENGLRVKIKGDEYLRIAKLIAHLGPLSLWEAMENGSVNTTYLKQLPEEFRHEYEPLVLDLEAQYAKILEEIKNDASRLPTHGTDNESRKQIALSIPSLRLRHPTAMFPFVLNKQKELDAYIKKHIRPTGNVMGGME